MMRGDAFRLAACPSSCDTACPRGSASTLRVARDRRFCEAICRFKARLKVRLKWRSDSGPAWRMPVYLSRVGDDVLLAARLDAGQRQFLAEDGGHFFHRQFDFEDVAAGLIAGLRLAVALRRGQRLADLAFARRRRRREPLLP